MEYHGLDSETNKTYSLGLFSGLGDRARNRVGLLQQPLATGAVEVSSKAVPQETQLLRPHSTCSVATCG